MSAMPPAMVLVDTRPSTIAPTNSCGWEEQARGRAVSACSWCGDARDTPALPRACLAPSVVLTKIAAMRTAWRRVMVLAPTEVPKAAKVARQKGVSACEMCSGPSCAPCRYCTSQASCFHRQHPAHRWPRHWSLCQSRTGRRQRSPPPPATGTLGGTGGGGTR
jgi:hypothetical protein